MRPALATLAGTMANAVARGRRRLQEWRRLSSEGKDTPKRATERSPKALFASSTDLKERLRDALRRKSYNVHDLYHETGIWQWIARHPSFELATNAMVFMNTIWMAVDMDFNTSDVLATASPLFRHAEHLFTGYFACEWVVRFCAFKRKRAGFRDGWFIFDSLLVFLMVMEDFVLDAFLLAGGTVGTFSLRQFSIIRIARLLRLTRIARMARVFQALPELLILIRGLATAMRSVVTTLGLLFIMVYIYGLIFRQVTMGIPILRDLYFSTVPTSMYTLLIEGIFMDSVGVFVRTLGQYSAVSAILFWVFVLSSSLTVMNMMIAVVCDAVGSVAATEKEAIQVTMVTKKMQDLFLELDETGDGLISREEFLKILEKPEASRLLNEAGIDVLGLVDHADSIFVAESIEGGAEQALTFDGLMEIVLSLRSSCQATVKDIIDLRKFTRTIVVQTNEHLTRIEDRLQQIQSDLRSGRRLPARPKPAPPPPHGGPPRDAGREVDLRKAAGTSELLAKARDLGAKLKEVQSAGDDVMHLSSRAEALRRAYKSLKGSPAGPKVSDTERDRQISTG